MNIVATSTRLASRFPLLACLAASAFALAIPDILIFHGGAAAIGRVVVAWRHYAQGHVESITWLLGVPLLGIICYTLKSNALAGRIATGVIGFFTAFTASLAAGLSDGDSVVMFVFLSIVLCVVYVGFLKLCDIED